MVSKLILLDHPFFICLCKLVNVSLLCSWLSITDPADVARVESRTFVVTRNRREAIPTAKENVKGQLGNWMSPDDLQKEIKDRFPGCMKGK